MTSWFGLQLFFVPSGSGMVRPFLRQCRAESSCKDKFCCMFTRLPKRSTMVHYGPLWSTEIRDMYCTCFLQFFWQFSHVLFMVFVCFCALVLPGSTVSLAIFPSAPSRCPRSCASCASCFRRRWRWRHATWPSPRRGFILETSTSENHRKTMGKPWENGGLMGFNGI